MTRKTFSKKELVIIAPIIVILLAVVMIIRFTAKDGKSVVIEVDGETYKTVEFGKVTEPMDIEVLGNDITLHVEITKDYARVLSSECPDKICVNMGKLTKSGQSAVCLPAKVVVKITGDGEDEIDGIT
ncbi:MAG: NusG domain II-containing protein [Clostridia bacterium]|nr:NusG domain II-containing protein [Clostridia bacterium]